MSDCARRYPAVLNALKKMIPFEPKGRQVQHLNVLAAIISGIVGSKSTSLPAIAGETPFKVDESSTVKRIERLLDNGRVGFETYYLPFAKMLIASLAHLPLVLVMDGSLVGRGCITLMVGVVYKKRTLPIAWIVVKGKKGHFPEKMHIDLVELVQPLIPEGAQVSFLGDGEFDGIDLLSTLDGSGWEFVCRTAKTSTLFWEGHKFSYEQMGETLTPGEDFVAPNALFTNGKYGPVLAIAWWRKDCKEPLYLVSNMSSPEEACQLYGKRFRIETFFSDQKSRGFNLHKSHISNPDRLSRLMMGACLAYYWIIYLGMMALEGEWFKRFHRTNRCDLSLFQLGLRMLKYLIKTSMPIPVVFGPPMRP